MSASTPPPAPKKNRPIFLEPLPLDPLSPTDMVNIVETTFKSLPDHIHFETMPDGTRRSRTLQEKLDYMLTIYKE